jgi:hypothetical protein
MRFNLIDVLFQWACIGIGMVVAGILSSHEKSDDEENPHASAIEVSDGARERAIIPSARSSRRRFTNSAGVAPTRAWNTRWKWYGESLAARDSSRSRSSSWRWLTTWSMARLTRSIYVAVVANRHFSEIRKIWQAFHLLASRSRGLELATKADESTTGPASLVLFDPDGNQTLIDQHVSSPPK